MPPIIPSVMEHQSHACTSSAASSHASADTSSVSAPAKSETLPRDRAARRRGFFGGVGPINGPVGRQDHGRGDARPGERAPACLIDSGDRSLEFKQLRLLHRRPGGCTSFMHTGSQYLVPLLLMQHKILPNSSASH